MHLAEGPKLKPCDSMYYSSDISRTLLGISCIKVTEYTGLQLSQLYAAKHKRALAKMAEVM